MDKDKLNQAFTNFTQASKTLEASYRALQEKIAKLTFELEAKNRRVHELEVQQERNKRLIAMGEMAAKIVHEIRNPLCSIELYASMLEKELMNETQRGLATGIMNGIGSLNAVLANMLAFARPHKPAFRPVQIDIVVADALRLAAPFIEARSVQLIFESGECVVFGDDKLLKQVFLNVIINAVQAVPIGGMVNVNVRCVDGKAAVSIKDNGSGISRENIDRIFDPFFTTKDTGTGLGLAIAASIVQAHDGSIVVESEEGSGSVFHLYFPLVQAFVTAGAE